MKTLFKKSAAAIMSLCVAFSAASAFAESSEVKFPATNEELEAYTKTKFNPYVTQLNMTTLENVENDYHGGEGYQCVYSYAISTANEDVMLYGNDTAGISYTHDGAKTWRLSKTSLPGPICGIAFYPESENVAFCLVTSAGLYSGVYRTLDSGLTWEHMTYLYANYKKFAQTPVCAGGKKDETTGNYPIYVTSFGSNPARFPYNTGDEQKRGLYKSTDMGETWECIAFEGINIVSMRCGKDNDTIIVTTKESGVSVSYDGGNTWVDKNNGFDYQSKGVSCLAVDPYNTDHWVVATGQRGTDDLNDDRDASSSKQYNVLYESYDGGDSWTHLTTDWGPRGVSSSCNITWLEFSYQKGDDGQTLLYASMNENVWGERVSYDGGKTFDYVKVDPTNASEPNSTGWYPGPVVATENVTLISRNQCSIYNEERGVFEVHSSGISGALAMTYDFDNEGNLRYIGLMDVGVVHCGKYTDWWDKFSWYDGDFPLIQNKETFGWGSGGRSTGWIAVDPRNPEHAFATCGAAPYGQNSTLVETFDGFDTSHTYQGMYHFAEEEKDAGRGLKYASFVKYNQSNPDVVYSSNFVSYNNGKHWVQSERQIYDCANNDGDICYSIVGGKKLYISTDCARTWKDTGYTFRNTYNDQKLFVDLFDDYVVWVCNHGNSTLYRVDIRNGEMKTFGPANGLKGDETARLPEDLQMMNFAQDPNNKDHLLVYGGDFYAGFTGFVFESYDGGESWEIVDGRPPYSNFMKFHPSKPIVYIGGAAGSWVYNFETKAKLDKDYFLDIDESEYKEEIKAVAKENIIKYDIEGNYYPSAKLNRVLMAKMILNARGDKLSASTIRFDDVSVSDENYIYIANACEKGYMTSEGNKFNPDKEITFKELAEYIMIILGREEANAYSYCVDNEIFKAEFEENAVSTNEQAAYALFNALDLEYIKSK